MRFVVTCPGATEPLDFARKAARAGAHYLEIRDDLTEASEDIRGAAGLIRILVSRRLAEPLPASWIDVAELVDEEISLPRPRAGIASDRIVLSHHAGSPMCVAESVSMWQAVGIGDGAIKHVEPYGPGCEERLIRLQDLLLNIAGRVTVLTVGEGAAALRRKLASRNHLHFCALTAETQSAQGQAVLSEELAHLAGADTIDAREAW
jgi:hypothetical protein